MGNYDPRWAEKGAKEFKDRNNNFFLGVMQGIVEQINPLTISILDKQALFSGEKLYVCKNVTEYQIPFSLTSPDGAVTGTITHEGVKVGDRVAVIATENNQKLFVIDKVV